MRHRHLGLFVIVSATAGLAACGSTSEGATPAGLAPVGTSDAGAGDSAPAGPAKPLTSLLIADVNRNGAIDENDATELADRETWDERHGAVFLANLDDDMRACKTSGQTDVQLGACNDAADEVINGADDLEDLAEIRLTAWTDMPDDASATLSVDEKASPNVRLFKKVGDAYQVLDLSRPFTANELKVGLELRLEGKDIARDSAVWDGTADFALTLSHGGAQVAVDKLRMRMAPVVSPNHLDQPTQVFASKDGGQLSSAFVAGISAIQRLVPSKGLPAAVALPSNGDIWTQDYWDPAYTSMPGKDGSVHALRLNFRAANYGRMWSSNGSNALRPGGRAAYGLRGKDVGVVVAFDPKHDDKMDSENSFGNMETLPPYTNGAAKFPLGRILRGGFSTNYPDRVFDKMLEAQKVQGPVLYVNTSWLIVGHIDEVLSFVKVDSPRGWAVLLADPAMARAAYQKLQDNGQGGLAVHAGKFIDDGRGDEISAATTVSRVLGDTDLMAANQAAQGYIDAIVAVLKTEVGLTDSEFIRVPFFIEQQDGQSVAYDPGTVNGISLGDGHFISPDPHGAAPGGADVLKTAFEQALAPFGITTHWIENWDLLHRNYGEVHCGSNVYREVPTNNGFWKSGK